MPRAEIPEGAKWIGYVCPECTALWVENEHLEPGVVVHPPECGPCGTEMKGVGSVVVRAQFEEELLGETVIKAAALRFLPAGVESGFLLVGRVEQEIRKNIQAALASISKDGEQ